MNDRDQKILDAAIDVWAVGCIFAPTDPVTSESPDTIVRPDKVEDITIVPEEPLDVESVGFWKVPLELQREEVHQLVVRRTLFHLE